MGISIGGSSGSSRSSQTSSPAQWVEDASRRGVGYAENMFNTNYRPYQGQRVAGLSENEQRAQQLAQNMPGQSYLGQSEGALGRAGEIGATSAAGGINQYMNPYRENVLDIANRKMGREYDQSLNQLRGQAASRGAFGGSRQTMLESNLKRDFLEAQGGMYQQGLDSAYGQALQAAQGDLARNLQGALAQAQGYSQLGTQAAGLTADQIRMLMGTGEAGRGVEQARLDAPYEEFLRGQDIKREDLDRFLASIRAGDYTRTGEGRAKENSGSFGFSYGGG